MLRWTVAITKIGLCGVSPDSILKRDKKRHSQICDQHRLFICCASLYPAETQNGLVQVLFAFANLKSGKSPSACLSFLGDHYISGIGLWPSDAIWRHWTGSKLAQVMVCCLRLPSHYPNQYRLVGRILFKKPRDLIMSGTQGYIFIQEMI